MGAVYRRASNARSRWPNVRANQSSPNRSRCMKAKGGARPRAGRKAVKIDLEQVEKLGGLQCTDAELAAFLGVSTRTIERRKKQPAFGDALARGMAKGLV